MKYRVTHHFNKPDTHVTCVEFAVTDGVLYFYNGDSWDLKTRCIAAYKSWRSIHLVSPK